MTLSISGGVLTATEIHPNAGWTAEAERREGREVEVTFRNGLRRIDFKAELEDGRLETRVVDRSTEGQDTPVATTPTTQQAENDDDHIVGDDDATPRVENDGDHSGPGGGDDDHSGHGGGDDSGHDDH